MSALRVAVVGLGWVGTHRHLPWLRRRSDVEVVGVIDHTSAKVERAKSLFRISEAAVAEGPGSVPWLDRVDAVTIATPPATHAALAAAYLKAGKDVLLEKPMALEVDKARELGDIARREERILAVVHNFQFARSTLRLRKLIADGRLGEVHALWGSQLSNPRRRLPEWYESLALGLFSDEMPPFFYPFPAFPGAIPEYKVVHVAGGKDGTTTPAA